MRRSLLLLPFLALLGGCLRDYALDYDQLHVSAIRSDGTPATTLPLNGCVTLPLLVGSRVDETIIIASQIDVDVSATRDRVTVGFVGAGSTPSRTISAKDLRSGYSESFEIESYSGQVFSVTLDSDCPKPDATSD